MIFVFEEGKLPSDSQKRKYVQRSVTARNEAAARSRLPKSRVGRIWHLVNVVNPIKLQGSLPEFSVDGVRFHIPNNPVPLRGPHGDIIGEAMIDLEHGTVDATVDQTTVAGMAAWEYILRDSMGLQFSVGPIPAYPAKDHS